MSLTKAQLDALRAKLLEEKKRTEATLASLVSTDPKNDTERANDNSDPGDDAEETMQLDQYEVLERQTRRQVELIDDALARLDAGTYGVTADGDSIPYERLLVDPTATTLVRKAS